MELLTQASLTINTVFAGAVAGTTNTFTTTVAIRPVINGKFSASLAVLTNSATTPTTDVNTGATFATVLPNTAVAVVFGVNAAGTLVAVQGAPTATETGVTTTVGAFVLAPQFPSIPENFCPIAYTLVRSAPSLTAGFTLGSTSWAASGASCTTFANICTLPARPQIA